MNERYTSGDTKGMTVRARRRREEAVRRLVADIQGKWLVAATVASALDKGLDRDLHAELVKEAKDNAGKIGQVCHDHADQFLGSVAQVAALSTPSADVADGLRNAHIELKETTAGPMQAVATSWETTRSSYGKARCMEILVQACQGVAQMLDRARKQAALGRPRAALDAVEKARTALTVPVDTLFVSPTDRALWNELSSGNVDFLHLEQTPFGKRAMVLLPRIESEVLSSAKRGLARWWSYLRTEAAAKAGRAALREAAHSGATGVGSLGLGGSSAGFIWRAQMASNWIARASTDSKVARAARTAYYQDRDAVRDEQAAASVATQPGCERYAEQVAAAMGWYRCWESDGAALLVDPAEYEDALMDASKNSGRSSLSGSRHGLSGSRHGTSRQGAGKGRSLGFRATTNSRSAAFQEMTSHLGQAKATNQASLWAELLIPGIFLAKAGACKEDDEVLGSLTESVHPVRRAEVAFRLLEKTEEFVLYYEQNRFGEAKVGESSIKSALAALTGEDVTIGTDRTFFAKTLPNLCASIVGFSAVESALELSNFVDVDEEEEKKTADENAATTGLKPSRFRDISERYERTLVTELGNLIRSRTDRANLGELVRMSRMLVSFRSALKLVHPSSTARRVDRELLALDPDLLLSAIRIVQDEQLKATVAVTSDDQKIPMLVSESPISRNARTRPPPSTGPNSVPDPEVTGLPFGLASMKQVATANDKAFQQQSRTSYNSAPHDESFTFSHSVPVILRAIHARAVACAVFALSQMELGQKFPDKKGSATGALVLDCVEQCVESAVIAMADRSSETESNVEKAVQIMANISAIQQSLPRLFGTILRGLFHLGCVRADQVDMTVLYAEKSLKASDKACDSQVGSAYSFVYEICRSKIDNHITMGLDNFNWVAKSAREAPNPYCDNVVAYLKTVFGALGPMDEGSRAGLHFSCCGHVSERLVKHLAGKPSDGSVMDDAELPPLSKIDAYGLKNLSLDCESLENFADSTAIPSLRDCFSELRMLTSVMLDKELPTLLLPENAVARRRKYNMLSLEKVGNMLEKYVGTGMFGGPVGRSDILFMDKKEVNTLLKVVRAQS